MSLFKYENKKLEIVDEYKTNNLYCSYSECQIADTKEYAIIKKIDKKKLKEKLSKLILINLNKTFQHYINAYKRDFQCLQKYKSNNILKCIDFINKEEELIIIKEFADINLLNYIKKEKKKRIRF